MTLFKYPYQITPIAPRNWVRKSLCRQCLISAFLIILSIETSYAGAWLLPKDQLKIITSTYFYQTKEVFDETGALINTESFEKIDWRPYIEWGFRDDITLGFSPSFQYLFQSNLATIDSNLGLSSVEFFLRTALWKSDSGIISLQPIISINNPFNNNTLPALSKNQADVEIRLQYGQNLSFGEYKYFTNQEMGYRKRMGKISDEVRFESTIGLSPYEEWLILGQVTGIMSFSDKGALSSANALNIAGYKLLNAKISAVIPLEKNVSLEVGYFKHVYGRNIGAGGGFLTSLWLTF